MTKWQKNKRLTLKLLIAWFVVTMLVGLAPEPLRFNFHGWEFTYWFGAQGAILIYLLITWLYAKEMRKIDKSTD